MSTQPEISSIPEILILSNSMSRRPQFLHQWGSIYGKCEETNLLKVKMCILQTVVLEKIIWEKWRVLKWARKWACPKLSRLLCVDYVSRSPCRAVWMWEPYGSNTAMVAHMIGARNNINTLLLIDPASPDQLMNLLGWQALLAGRGAGEIIAHCYDTNSP